MSLGLQKGTMGALGQCTHWTRTPLRFDIRNRVLGNKGGMGKIRGGGGTTLSSMLQGEDRWGAAKLCSDPCRDEQEGTVVLCYVHLKHNKKIVQIQKQLHHWWQEKYRWGKNTQYTSKHKNKHPRTSKNYFIFTMLYVQFAWGEPH